MKTVLTILVLMTSASYVGMSYSTIEELSSSDLQTNSLPRGCSEAVSLTNVLANVFATNRTELLWELKDRLTDHFSEVCSFELLATNVNALLYCADQIGGFQPVSTNARFDEMRSAYALDLPAIIQFQEDHQYQRPPLSVTPNLRRCKIKWRMITSNNLYVRSLRESFALSLSLPIRKFERTLNDADRAAFRTNFIGRARLSEAEQRRVWR